METGLTGLEQTDMFSESEIKLQLPCNDRNFIQEIPCITEALYQGYNHVSTPEFARPLCATENMGLVAYFVRLAWLRKKVLKYVQRAISTHILLLGYSTRLMAYRFVKTTDLTMPTNILAAEFSAVNTMLQQWHSSLPTNLHLNSNTIYIRKETNQLSALFTIHLMYYSTICDLHSIGDRRLSHSSLRDEFPERPSPEQLEFLSRCRKMCFENAKDAARILTKAVQHGSKVFSDTWMLLGVFGIIRVLWCHITFPLEQGTDAKRSMLEEVLPLVHSCMEALRLMRPLFFMAGRVVCANIPLIILPIY